jgi:thiol:disulfide interchange protein DsbD
VLPVLALKLYSLIEQQDAGVSYRRRAGIAYTLGVILSFMAVAIAVIIMKQVVGVDVAWGFMFQEPTYVIGLATVVFIFGLSLIGVFDVPALGANKAAQASSGSGMQGHFLTGVFATLIATPCSAPFLGPAMGFALTLDQLSIMLFFGVAGLGLALPFLLVAFVPALIQFLPKPGAWMESFKKVVGWSMMGVVLWLLVWVFGAMSTYKGVMAVCCFMGAVAIGCGVFGKYGSIIETGQRQLSMMGLALLIGAGGGWLSMDWTGWLEMPEPELVEEIKDPLVCATD